MLTVPSAGRTLKTNLASRAPAMRTPGREYASLTLHPIRGTLVPRDEHAPLQAVCIPLDATHFGYSAACMVCPSSQHDAAQSIAESTIDNELGQTRGKVPWEWRGTQMKAIACEVVAWLFRRRGLRVMRVHVSGPCARCDLPCMCHVPCAFQRWACNNRLGGAAR